MAQLALTGLGVVDTLMSGMAGTQDLAAIGLGSSIMLPIFIFGIGVLMAITPLVGKAYGKNDGEAIGRFLNNGFWVAIPLALLSSLLMANMQPVLNWLSLEPTVYQLTEEYLWYIAFGMPAVVFYQVLRFYWEGLGQTLPSMWISFWALLINIPLNALFIFGWGELEPMGAAGCGVASAIVMWTMLLIGMVYVFKNRLTNSFLNWSGLLQPRWALGIGPMLKIGIPNAFALLFEVSLFTLVALFVAPLGTEVIAAQQIAISVTSLLFMLPLSWGLALTVRVGQVYGRGDVAHMQLLLKISFSYALLIGLLLAFTTWFWRSEISALYTADSAVIGVAVILLIFASAYQIFDAVQVACAGVLRGFHDTQVTMWVTFFSYWLVGLGLGYVLSLTDWLVAPMGVNGFWLGICLGLGIAAILLAWRLLFKLPDIYREMRAA
ncbi:putative multidrug resistance protein NorM [Thiosulfatimonas sediminis]|uniref:Multidrug-efflux transporter n=2 Tax=Thiosulfatimonas sediminis TaxID=2675054 RepID=A0A6F8PV25_9GAMM|nr:putative multidrug resistance protein NorM [Thiosulfatimonas sediminis]